MGDVARKGRRSVGKETFGIRSKHFFFACVILSKVKKQHANVKKKKSTKKKKKKNFFQKKKKKIGEGIFLFFGGLGVKKIS